MNRLKKIVYVLFLITTALNAQEKRIQFVSDENKLPLSNVEVYDGNLLIGKSDPNGYLEIKTEESNYLHTIKEYYKDSFIKVSDLQENVTLIKNKTILVEEVMIGRKARISVGKILKRIHDTFELDLHVIDLDKYKLPDYYHVTNKRLMEKDTLHYLNGLMTYVPGKGEYINENFRLVRKFKFDASHHGLIYYVNKKDMNFYGDWSVRYLTVPYSFDNDNVLLGVLERRKNYRYTVTNIGGFYRVEFESKDNSPLSFEGYLLVDKTDFGIYEFKAHLSDNIENIEKSAILQSNTEQVYHVTATDYYTKYQRDKDGVYKIISSYADKQFEQTKGNFKGKKFSFSSTIEADDNYKDFEFIGFNPYTYELKMKLS